MQMMFSKNYNKRNKLGMLFIKLAKLLILSSSFIMIQALHIYTWWLVTEGKGGEQKEIPCLEPRCVTRKTHLFFNYTNTIHLL